MDSRIPAFAASSLMVSSSAPFMHSNQASRSADADGERQVAGPQHGVAAFGGIVLGAAQPFRQVFLENDNHRTQVRRVQRPDALRLGSVSMRW